MKFNSKTQYRFYRPRRPEVIGTVLKLEGVTYLFGLVGSVILVIIGIAMLLIHHSIDKDELVQGNIQLEAPPYKTRKLRNTILPPVMDARVIALNPSTFSAANPETLMALKKGEILNFDMTRREAEKWNKNEARKDYYQPINLEKKGEKSISVFEEYDQKATHLSSQGWWVIVLGILFIPYQFIQKPKVLS